LGLKRLRVSSNGIPTARSARSPGPTAFSMADIEAGDIRAYFDKRHPNIELEIDAKG
jgi:hypothetical protein